MPAPPRPGLFPTAAQWRDLRTAWRGRRENPLLHYFELGRTRRLARLPWWRKHLILLVGASTGALMARVTWEPSRVNPEPLWELVAQALLVWISFMVLAFLISRLFESMLGALHLLSRAVRRVEAVQPDVTVLMTQLSLGEVLVGSMSALYGRLLLPLALGATIATTFFLMAQAREISQVAIELPEQLMFWALIPLGTLGIYASGLLAVLTLLLLAFCAGRGMRMGVHASVVAVLYSLGALMFFMVTQGGGDMAQSQYGAQHYPELAQELGRLEPLPFLILAFLLVTAVLAPIQLIRRAGVALSVLYGLPLLFIGNVAALVFAVITYGSSTGFDPTHWFMDTFVAWSMFAPVSVLAVPHPACLGTGYAHMLADPAWHQWRWPLLIAVQLVLVCGLLRSALDSIALAREAGAE